MNNSNREGIWIPLTGGIHMSDLDSQKLAQLRSVLEQRAAALRQELRQTLMRSDTEKAQLLRDEVRDNGDDSFLDLIADVNMAEVERDYNEYRAVNTALTRMSAGEYGSCEHCGRAISLKRLEVQPFATRCVTCQEQYEHLMSAAKTPTL
jgi:DnaK suppressor protein